MPATVLHDPLRIECAFPDGSRFDAFVNAPANERLAADLAAGFPQLVHPLGTAASSTTVSSYLSALRGMVAWLTEAGFTGGAANLTRSTVIRYWLAATPSNVALSRKLLRAVHAATGNLDPELVPHLTGRSIKPVPPSEPTQPYSETEWARLQEALRQVVNQAWADHREALALAEQGRHPREHGLTRENMAWLLRHHGPMSGHELAEHAGFSLKRTRVPDDLASLREALYPSAPVMMAHRFLFGSYSGIVPDGIADLELSDITWAGDSTVLLDYVKGRTGPESATLPKRAVRVLERWLELSAPLRALADDEFRGALWLRLRRRTTKAHAATTYLVAGLDGNTLTNGTPHRELVRRAGLLDDAGKPFHIHSRRIRTTYINTLSRRGWTGHTTIDPNHSPAVEGDHYLTAQTPGQMLAVEAIIEDGQADILRRAVPPAVVTEEEMARYVAELPATAAALGVDTGVLSELLAGERDVFTASCKDQFAGLHGPAGKPCPARPWVCLLCPLAVFLPRHAPNLLRLRAFFARQFRQMTTAQFVAVFGPYADRLDQEILPRIPAAALEKAAAQVADTDAEVPLRPEETTL